MAQNENIEFGIRIYLDDTYIVSKSIPAPVAVAMGLYEVAGENDQARWATSTVAFPVEDWTEGLIIRGSISTITMQADFRRGGNVNKYGGVAFEIDNTTKLWKTLEDYDIYLEGLSAELVEFDMDAETTETVFRGIINFESYSETEYSLKINVPNDKRTANIATVIMSADNPTAGVEEVGETIPVVYGATTQSAFIRTAQDRTILDLTNFGATITPNDQKSVPVIEYQGDTLYIRMGNETTLADTAAFSSAIGVDLTDDYFIYSLTGQGQGQYRKIESIEWRPDRVPGTQGGAYPFNINFEDYPILKVVLAAYYDDDLKGNWYASYPDNTWIQIVQVSLTFDGETASTAGFTDGDGNIITDTLTIYNSEQDLKLDYNPITGELLDSIIAGDTTYVPLPSYGIAVVTSADRKSITIDPRYLERDVGNIVAYGNIDITPHFYEEAPSEFDKWVLPAGEGDDAIRDILLADDLSYRGTGVYTRNGFGNGIPTNVYEPYTSFSHVPNAADLAKLSDNKWSTPLSWGMQQGVPGNIGGLNRTVFALHCLEFDVPYELLESIDYDSLYFSFAADAYTDGGNIGQSARIGTLDLIIRGKSFWGGISKIYEDPGQTMSCRQGINYAADVTGQDSHWCANKSAYTQNAAGTIYTGGVFNNYVEEYWDGDVPQDLAYRDRDQDFYDDTPIYVSGGPAAAVRSGNKTMEIPGGKSDHLSLRKIGLFFYVEVATGAGMPKPFTLNIRQCSLITKSSTTLNAKIFFPFDGRSTDGTQAGLIDNPISFLEDLCYRQNWSELNGAAPTNGWGQGRAATVLIKNDSEHGAFNYPGYSYEKSLKLRSVITDASKAYTDKLKKKICQQFFLASYQTNNGYEAVDSIVNPLADDEYVYTPVTLDEIIGKISPITQNGYKDIFCQPVIYYNKNTATNLYDSNMEVTNVDKDTFDTTYVSGSGISDGYKERIWGLARGLYMKYRIINEAPTSLTELDLIYRDEEAGYYLYNWLYWQSRKRVSFTIPYGLGKDWYLTKRFKLLLPHQTDGSDMYCIVEKIAKDVPTAAANKTSVKIQAVIYNAGDDEQFYIQDVYRTPTDWTDTYNPGDPEIQDTID